MIADDQTAITFARMCWVANRRWLDPVTLLTAVVAHRGPRVGRALNEKDGDNRE
jgi:hypothetical protein